MSLAVGLTITLAVGIGISLGLLGGGGSILAVPLLVYVTGLPAREAIGTSAGRSCGAQTLMMRYPLAYH